MLWKNESITYCLLCKGRSNDDVGVARGSVFQEIRPGSGFKTGDFVKEKTGDTFALQRSRIGV